MARARRRRKSTFNPFISLTDVLFNLLLVLIFASALLAQDLNARFAENRQIAAENREFQNRIAALNLERDELVSDIEILEEDLNEAAETEASLEEQINGLVNNLDAAGRRQRQLSRRLNLVVGELENSSLENALLNQELTVVLGRVEGLEIQNLALTEDATLLLGELEQAEDLVNALSRNNFLVVELEWLTEAHDLDLHVIDPNGNRFYWDQASYEGESARLTLDNRIGARPNKPGLEIWTARDLDLGTYRVEVGLWGCGRSTEQAGYTPCQSPAVANVLLRHRDGDELISGVTLGQDESYAQVNGADFRLGNDSFNRLQLVAEIEVKEVDEKLELEFRPAGNLETQPLGGRP